MKQVLQYNKEKHPRVVNVPEPQMKGAGLLVENRVSLISVGTERSMIELSQMSLVGKARQRPDIVRQVVGKIKTEGIVSTYNKVMGRLKTPTPMGYSSAGIVRQVHDSVERFTVGQRVACAGFAYACHADRIYVPSNLAVRIPDKVSFEEASFVTVGAIALQGVRVADVRLGETVAVVGLGLLGQLTCMLLAASGCRVIGLDIDKSKIHLAHTLGVENAFASDKHATDKIMNLTGGRGADVVIITAASQSTGPVTLAGDIARHKGVVVVVGDVKMDIPRPAYYNKELEFKMSCSYGPGRYDYKYEEAGQDYPYGYVRWTENRNMEAFLELIASTKISVKELITHRFDITDAEKAYEVVSGKTDESPMGVVLTYPELDASKMHLEKTGHQPTTKWNRVSANSDQSDGIGIGFVGAGGFASGVLLPNLARLKKFHGVAIMSGSGVTATSSAQRFDFAGTSSSLDEMLNNDAVGAIFIANRHDQHAKMVEQSLSSGRPTFVEKPLCLNREELNRIVECHSSHNAPLMIGFNRRFAPLVQLIKDCLADNKYPLSMHYRINAGFIPSATWIQDADCGGGRIIGELCHFIDLLGYLCGATPESVTAQSLEQPNERFRNDDNLQIMIRFTDGSVGTINYVASGNKLMSKEYIEIFGGGLGLCLDDFRSLTIADSRGLRMEKKRGQDKGHFEMLRSWETALAEGKPSPTKFDEIVAVTDCTFAIIDSLSSGEREWIKS